MGKQRETFGLLVNGAIYNIAYADVEDIIIDEDTRTAAFYFKDVGPYIIPIEPVVYTVYSMWMARKEKKRHVTLDTVVRELRQRVYQMENLYRHNPNANQEKIANKVETYREVLQMLEHVSDCPEL